jgi:hypothetical protein
MLLFSCLLTKLFLFTKFPAGSKKKQLFAAFSMLETQIPFSVSKIRSPEDTSQGKFYEWLINVISVAITIIEE